MHLLSRRNRSEFLAVPALLRFTLANGQHGPEATLLIKASSLILKYLLRLQRFHLLIFRVSANWLAYAVRIEDDKDHPATIWSLLEYDDEFFALLTLVEKPKCFVFLFNELAVNVTWGEVEIDLSDRHDSELIRSSALHPRTNTKTSIKTHATDEVAKELDALHRAQLAWRDGQVVKILEVPEWHSLESHYITNRASSSLISIFEGNEGRQQEEIALWLIDNLQPIGAVRSPQIHEKKVRELTDLLISHEYGPILIESKVLGIISRNTLPNRSKLAADLVKDLQKATRQLIGGVKNLQRGYRITDIEGRELEVERIKPPHVIILVPDLSLLFEATQFGGEFIRTASASVGGFFHILDLFELLRIVQAAEMISARSETVSRIMAFDYYLMERAKRAAKSETPNFGILLRFDDEIIPIDAPVE